MPSMATMFADLHDEPKDIAVFRYQGVQHFAQVLLVNEDTMIVDEANFKSCHRATRMVRLDDPNLLGFYTPH